jgi:hypothetical protein
VVTEAVNAKLVPQLPDPDQNLVRWQGVLIRYDGASVDEVLDKSEYFDGAVWQSLNILDVVPVAKLVTVVGRLRTEKVLLQAEWNLVWADQDHDKLWVRFQP